MNAYKVQIRISVMTKKLSKFKMYSTLQNKKSNKSQTVRTLKHSFIGNLSGYTTEDDLCELFGIRSTNHLKQNCSVKMSTNSITGKKKYFAYVTAPEDVTAELIKLNRIEIYFKCIIVEEAKNKLTAFSEANVL